MHAATRSLGERKRGPRDARMIMSASTTSHRPLPPTRPPGKNTHLLEPVLDDARLEVEEQGAGDIVAVVCLVEEDILAVVGEGVARVLLEHALHRDAVLLAHCEGPDTERWVGRRRRCGGRRSSHGGAGGIRRGGGGGSGMVAVKLRAVGDSRCFQNSVPTWLPHWPTCSVMISRGILASSALRALRSGPPLELDFIYNLDFGKNGWFAKLGSWIDRNSATRSRRRAALPRGTWDAGCP